MKTRRYPYPDPDDFFADTRMSFGEHIEELRRHLLRALAGFAIAVGISFFFGHLVLRLIAAPIERELEVYYTKRLEKAKQEYLEQLHKNGDLPNQRYLWIPRSFLEQTLHLKVPGDQPELAVPVRWDWQEEVDYWVRNYQHLAPRPTLKSFTIMETVLVWLKVCLLLGLVLGSPWIFYQIWSFIAAGLYPHEKRLVNHYLPISVGLFLGGVVLCQVLVLPHTISALLWFNSWLGFEPELRLNDWLSFALLLPVLFGLCFQTPLVMLALERLGVASVEGFRKKRLVFLFVMMVIFAIVSPTPDPFVTPAVFFVCIWGLYELGIWLCKLTPRAGLFDWEAPAEEMVEV